MTASPIFGCRRRVGELARARQRYRGTARGPTALGTTSCPRRRLMPSTRRSERARSSGVSTSGGAARRRRQTRRAPATRSMSGLRADVARERVHLAEHRTRTAPDGRASRDSARDDRPPVSRQRAITVAHDVRGRRPVDRRAHDDRLDSVGTAPTPRGATSTIRRAQRGFSTSARRFRRARRSPPAASLPTTTISRSSTGASARAAWRTSGTPSSGATSFCDPNRVAPPAASSSPTIMRAPRAGGSRSRGAACRAAASRTCVAPPAARPRATRYSHARPTLRASRRARIPRTRSVSNDADAMQSAHASAVNRASAIIPAPTRSCDPNAVAAERIRSLGRRRSLRRAARGCADAGNARGRRRETPSRTLSAAHRARPRRGSTARPPAGVCRRGRVRSACECAPARRR